MSQQDSDHVRMGRLSRPHDGYFQCGYCKRHYNRADHLIRHVRSHTQEKPYVCHVCGKGFARPDLLKRHATGHQQRDGKRKRPASYVHASRVTQACTSCAASKLKCDEEKPCRRCRDRSLTCEWLQQDLQDVSPEPDQVRENVLPSPMSGQDRREHETRNISTEDVIMNSEQETQEYQAVRGTPFTASNMAMENFSPYDELDDPRFSIQSPLPSDAAIPSSSACVSELDGAFFPDFHPNTLIPSLNQLMELSQAETIHNSYNQHDSIASSMQLDFDLNDVDFGLIESFNERISQPADHPNTGTSDQETDRLDSDSAIAIGEEAYHKSSLANWTPIHEDHGYADQDNLSIPKSIDSPENINTGCNKTLTERLSPSSRDVIFGMVLKICRKANLSRIMRSFPSTELLDSLLQSFFKRHTAQIDSWIHAPTFKPNEEGPEILTALAAAGAVQSSIPTIRKLGYALMEIVRLQLPEKFENDNATTRELRVLQAYALVIDIGLWSGNRRRTEIAESFEQPSVTMLRRALRFRRSTYPAVIVQHDEYGPNLEKKWHEWVQMESFKRLVYHFFLHDAQASIALNINPLISYAELQLPLPARRELWEAKTAEEWKNFYLSCSTTTIGPGTDPDRFPSLSDTLRDMSQLTAFERLIDHQLAGLLSLHGISALITEYHRIKSISRGQSKHWHALMIQSRHQELYQALQHFRMICCGREAAPEILLIQEMMAMLLHMSLEDLQLFAGKEDKKAARGAYSDAVEWIKSTDSRRAVWHAGQAVRVASECSPGLSLSGFYAIVIYYASLAFWSYGVISSRVKDTGTNLHDRRDPSYPTGPAPPAPTILLNEEPHKATTDVQMFIELGRGSPALKTGGTAAAFLDDPSATIDFVRELLRSSFRDDDEAALPPLVQSLCQLMRDLGNAAKKMKTRQTA
ncbi:hypothetical protein VTN77DRAFT_5111 [Rasamsonia byssochlamydoides]|uniref:uncharacterized protein n=1 Tax=Rasamsonia byssochlamydoides TaxID=89139 RepID=UPI0037428C05